MFRPYSYRFFEDGGFPSSFDHEGAAAVFNTDFRVWLRYEQLAKSTMVTAEEKTLLVLDLCYSAQPETIPADILIKQAIWFHGCDFIDRSDIFNGKGMQAFKSIYQERLKKQQKRRQDKGPDYDFFWDATVLWGSFMSAYNIDLFRVDLHWWAFVGLVNELPEQCGFQCLRRLRAAEPQDAPMDKRTDLRLSQALAAVPKDGVL